MLPGLAIESTTVAAAESTVSLWTDHTTTTVNSVTVNGQTITVDSAKSSTALCDPGSFPIGACTTGRYRSDCTDYIAGDYGLARTFLICAPLPTANPTLVPTLPPTPNPTEVPTTPNPTEVPTTPNPTEVPTTPNPTKIPTHFPTLDPATPPTAPTPSPTNPPTLSPSEIPTLSPSEIPTLSPSEIPTLSPTNLPTLSPSEIPTTSPAVSTTTAPTTSSDSESSTLSVGAWVGIALAISATLLVGGIWATRVLTAKYTTVSSAM